MNELLEWLLSLQRIELLEGSAIELQWQEPMAPWLWFMMVLVVVIYVYVTYRRDGGSTRARVVMGTLRASIILLAILLLCQPALVHRRNRIEPSTVALLIDTSASMGLRDYYPPERWTEVQTLLPEPAEAASCTRWQLTQAALNFDNLKIINDLLRHHHLRFFRFAGSTSGETIAEDPDSAAATVQALNSSQPSGQLTNIAASLKQVFDGCIDAHLTAIVMFTDGQPTQQEDLDRTARMLKSRGTPVHIVATGSPDPPIDLALEDVRTDSHVYLGDRVAVHFQIRSAGFARPSAVQALLKDADSDEPLAHKTLMISAGVNTQAVELQFEPGAPGRQRLLLEIPAVEGELEASDNAQQIQITVVDDKVKVLYVDGYPRYEYRYLKNTLLREPSVTSSVLLLSADDAFVQEGSDPIRRFPNTAEELNEYDVVLFGDLDPSGGWITEAQLQLLLEFVGRHGGGFGVIAGDRHRPQMFYGTSIDAIIPAELGGHIAEQLRPATNQAYNPEITPAGRESPILRLHPDAAKTVELFDRLPPLYWGNAVRAAKPAAEVLLQHPDLVHNGDHLPLVITGRYGAGLTFYQGTDETWRWRRYRGEAFFDTYWLQVVRYLARNKKFHTASQFTLRTNRKIFDPNQPVVISLEVADPAHATQLPDTVMVNITSARGVNIDQAALTRLTANSKFFQGGLLSADAGQFEIVFSPRRFGVEEDDIRWLFEVEHRSLENVKPEANIALMEELAEATGGRTVEPWAAVNLAEVIPRRRYSVPDDVIETIWDSKLALILFAILIAAEWILRKTKGLV